MVATLHQSGHYGRVLGMEFPLFQRHMAACWELARRQPKDLLELKKQSLLVGGDRD